MLSLHKNTTTPPAIREQVVASEEPAASPAVREQIAAGEEPAAAPAIREQIVASEEPAASPAVREQIAAGEEPAAALAARRGGTLDTICRRRDRTGFADRAHTAHRLATTLTPAQDAVADELRRMLPLPLDDLLAVAREFPDPDVSRSGLEPSPSGSNRWHPMARSAPPWYEQSQGLATKDPG
jgi:hypothetical protein